MGSSGVDHVFGVRLRLTLYKGAPGKHVVDTRCLQQAEKIHSDAFTAPSGASIVDVAGRVCSPFARTKSLFDAWKPRAPSMTGTSPAWEVVIG